MFFRDLEGLVIVQDPDATRTRTIDFGSSALPEANRWLAAGETITELDVDPGGATLVSSGFDDELVTLLISGVTEDFAAGGHDVRIRLTTSAGQVQDFTFKLVAGQE